jgi:hypothetical protein
MKFYPSHSSFSSINGKLNLEKELIPLIKDYKKKGAEAKIQYDRINPKAYFTPTYPGSMEISQVDNMKINGVPSKISCFKTKDRQQKVFNHYSSLWRAEGRNISKKNTPDYMTLSSLNPINKKFETIIIPKGTPYGTTQVFHAVMIVDKIKPGKERKDIPNFIVNRKNLHVKSKDGGKNANTFIDFMKTNSINCRNFYRNQMRKEGWKEFNPKSSLYRELEKNSFLFFIKDSMECLINFQDDKEQKGTLIFINIMKRG